MGYMGFGMRKEDYTRKPKTSFTRIKEVYGDHLENFKSKKVVHGEWTEKDKEDFKKFVKNKIGRNRIQEDIYNSIIYFLLILIVGAAFYFTKKILF